jgi:23S rRNA pseudouridine2605 synthase
MQTSLLRMRPRQIRRVSFYCSLVKPIRPRPAATNPKNKTKKVGLARALSKLGFCSRTQAFALVREGKVQLNGTASRNPEAPVRMGVDRIAVEGQKVSAAEKVYVMLNKPRGIVTTADDERARETVYSLLPGDWKWIAPVGRLDKASEGLLLLTNDPEWAAHVTDPQAHVDKVYHVQIAAVADERVLNALRNEIREGGEILRAKRVERLRSGEKSSWLEITLDEGKNRQIRRMLAAIGVEVLRLVRVAIGPLRLGELTKSTCRNLTPEEKKALDAALKK